MRILFLLCWLAFVVPAMADDDEAERPSTWVNAGFLTLHFVPGLNNVNTGLGVEYQFNSGLAVVGGFYKNSFEKNSNYAAAIISPWQEGEPIKFAVMAGVVDGYPEHPSFQPMLLPGLVFVGERVGANLVYMPPIGGIEAGGIALQLRVKVK